MIEHPIAHTLVYGDTGGGQINFRSYVAQAADRFYV